jgi:diaminohydroxyphosphoribosylaminopyrimidine deaminase/5-amino-6-(5-phosphoribosylamino)uracil reductase
MYVSLEPCAHHGKTPPCADLIIENGIPQVITGSGDPNPLVAGKGIAKLRDAGIEVTEHILQEECDYLNRRFMTFHIQHRPYTILKWAQSADGFFAPEGSSQMWLTNEYSKKLVHKWRTEEDAILIGTNTAIIDDPQLTARLWPGNNPTRLLIDMDLKVTTGSKIFDEQAMTIVYNAHREGLEHGIIYVKIARINIPVQIVSDLYHRKLMSVIIEGGAHTLSHFISAGLWDEARIFSSPKVISNGIRPPQIGGRIIHSEEIADDMLTIKRNDA